MGTESIKDIVKDAYGKIAKGFVSCCPTCTPDPRQYALSIGYGEDELKVIPSEANLGLGC